MFRKLDLLPSSGEGGMIQHTQLVFSTIILVHYLLYPFDIAWY